METLMNDYAWLLWGLAGIGLFVMELLTPGFVVACFGVGAFFATIPAALDLSLPWQLIAFCTGSILSLIFLRPMLTRKPASESYPIGLEALKGRKIRLSQDIPAGEYIEVPIDGDVWRLQMKDAQEVSKGDIVTICGRSGLMLYAMKDENQIII